ncbi:unnamed protein product [Peniophora sp. CBMAI 1063]|nr:unnamed protein product [Peniophora sp. CBMAI 1063]
MKCMMSRKEHLDFVFKAITSLGLASWMPDIYSNNPTSLYNLLHERIAISTFQYMCNAFAYTLFKVNLEYASQSALLQQIYHHYVFSYMRLSREKAENGGNLQLATVLEGIYKRRKSTRKDRVRWLQEQNYNPAVIRVFKSKHTTSEDEYDAALGGYVVKAVEGPSAAMTSFATWVDGEIAKVVKPGRGKTNRSRKMKRKRIRLPNPPAPIIVALPKNVPIDYYDPDYFNVRFLPRDRAKFSNCGVALPLPSVRGDTVREHKVIRKTPAP